MFRRHKIEQGPNADLPAISELDPIRGLAKAAGLDGKADWISSAGTAPSVVTPALVEATEALDDREAVLREAADRRTE